MSKLELMGREGVGLGLWGRGVQRGWGWGGGGVDVNVILHGSWRKSVDAGGPWGTGGAGGGRWGGEREKGWGGGGEKRYRMGMWGPGWRWGGGGGAFGRACSVRVVQVYWKCQGKQASKQTAR